MILMLLWPNRSEITFTLTPLASSKVACVWRKSWNRIFGTAAFLIQTFKLLLTVAGLISVPERVHNTKSLSWYSSN